MKKRFCLLAAGLALLATQSFAQTKTVGSGGDYATLAAAITFFTPDPDTGAPNVINIIDSGLYDEVITITVPLTIQSSAASAATRPRVAVRNNAAGEGNDGFLVLLSAPGDVTLKNFNIIPSTTTPPTDDLFRSSAGGTNLTLENIVMAPNIGNQPVSFTGDAPVSLVGATFNTDDGAVITGAGTSVSLKHVIITHIQNGTAARDGLILNLAAATHPASVSIKEGCVFSYCSRLGMSAAPTTSFSIDGTAGPRVLIKGNKGFAGLWFAGPQTTLREIKGCNILDQLGENNTNNAWGIENQNLGASGASFSDMIIANNISNGIKFGDTSITGGGSFTTSLTRVTIAKSAGAAITIPVAAAANGLTNTVNITDSIIAGNGAVTANEQIVNNNTGTLTIDHSAVVTAGPLTLSTPATAGTGPIVQTNNVSADPAFVSTTFGSPDFYKVGAASYATAATGGTGLKGGGPAITSAVGDWTAF